MESRTSEELCQELDQRLTEALEMTFPASDPIALREDTLPEDRGDDPDAEPETSQGR